MVVGKHWFLSNRKRNEIDQRDIFLPTCTWVDAVVLWAYCMASLELSVTMVSKIKRKINSHIWLLCFPSPFVELSIHFVIFINNRLECSSAGEPTIGRKHLLLDVFVDKTWGSQSYAQIRLDEVGSYAKKKEEKKEKYQSQAVRLN